MKKYLSIFISSTLAGFCIVIGACVFLMLKAKGQEFVGSLCFGLGLFTIIHFGFHLYTGKVSDVLNNKPKYIIDLVVCLIGNIIGVILLTLIIKQTRLDNTLIAQAQQIVQAKENDSWYSLLILSSLCGVMIYLAVKGHAKCEYPIGKVLFCFLAISIFILCGFEHCVANCSYYTLAGVFNIKVLFKFIIMILGNAIGAIAFDGLLKLMTYLNKGE